MSKIAMWFRKIVMVGVVISLGLAVMPMLSVYALGSTDPATPTAPTPGQISTDRLQTAWAREQAAYDRIGNLLDRADTLIPRIQSLIDKAKANGKDISALQAALDAFSSAVKQVHPIYESSKGIIASHKGFDDAGNVTDPAAALETVKGLRDNLKEMRQTLGTTLADLRDAIQALRGANPTSTPPSNSQGG